VRDQVGAIGLGSRLRERAVLVAVHVALLCAAATAGALKTTNEQKLVPEALTGDDEIGVAVALGGGFAVVGAPLDSTLGDETGAVYVYGVASGGLAPVAKLTAGDGVAADNLGNAVDIDGDTIAAGAYHRWSAVGEPGRAYVFRNDGVSWVEEAKLVAPDGVAKDAFGWSIAVDGDTLAVGAPRAWTDSPAGGGAAYVFRRIDGEWEFDTKLSRGTDHSFGWSLDLDGDTLVIGSSLSPNERVSVYVRDGGGNWNLEETLDPADSSSNEFGNAVAIDGHELVVGSWYDAEGSNFGAVYFYHRNGTSWSLVEKVGSPGGERAEAFGESVAIDGGLAVVTDSFFDLDDEELFDIGAAFLYKRKPSGWSLAGTMVPSDAEPWNNYFGVSSAISGARILIGSPYSWDEAIEDYPGAAYSYEIARGSRLVIKNSAPDNEFNNRIVFKGRGLEVDVPLPGSADDPTCGGGGNASIEIKSVASGEIFSQTLPCANWEQNAKGYLYRDPELDDGPCRIVSFAPGKTSKAVCSGQGPSVLDFDLEPSVAQVPVGVKLTLGASSYCVTFGGTVKADGSNGVSFKASKAGGLEPCN